MVTQVAGCGRSLLRITALAGILALPACASLTSGTEQTITVVTAPVVGASCTLQNAAGSWRVASTPGTVTIRRAYGELTVACAAADGASGEATTASSVAPATYANILLMGSVVWAAVDAASGAAFAYPERLTVPLQVAAVAVPAAAVASAGGAAMPAAPDDPQTRIAQLRQLREEHRISAVEFQLRLAEIAAASAKVSVAVAPPLATLAGAPAVTATADDPRSRLQQLRQLRAEHRISAMEYQLRLAELVERGGLPAEALK